MIRQTKKKMREVKLQLRFSLRLGLGLMTLDGLSLVPSVFRVGIEPTTLLISALATELLTSLTSY